jgi:hypothetical protein
VMRVGIALPSR